jgi:hypothetical protein
MTYQLQNALAAADILRWPALALAAAALPPWPPLAALALTAAGLPPWLPLAYRPGCRWLAP